MQLYVSLSTLGLVTLLTAIAVANTENGEKILARGETISAAWNYIHGVSIDGDCTAHQTKSIKLAMKNARTYLTAAHSATQDPDRTLFHYFFNNADFPRVKTTLRNIRNRLLRTGPAVLFFCEESPKFNNCENTAYAYASMPAATENSKVCAITLCPEFFAVPDLPNACDRASLMTGDHRKSPGVIENYRSKAELLLHEMLHVPWISGPDVRNIKDLDVSPSTGHLLVTKQAEDPTLKERGLVPTLSVTNYVFFIQWAWIRKEQKTACPDAYPLWDVLDEPPLAEMVEKVELRRLLSNGTEASDPVVCADLDDCLPPLSGSNSTAGSTEVGEGEDCVVC